MIAPKKSLGQHFLRDENIARKIVEQLHPERGDIILEIGSGVGALTKHLVGRPAFLISVDVDRRAVSILKEQYGTQVECIHANILDVSLDHLRRKYGKRVRVVGNIPYNLTSEILFWLFDARESVRDAALMMQLEVARRLIARARTKEYGILSVFTQFYAHPEILFRVSPHCFYPRPEVFSAFVKLSMKALLPEHNNDVFRNVVRSTFGKRRKTLSNGLRYMGMSNSQLKTVEFDLKKRPEELTVEEFLDLTRKLGKFEREMPELKY